MKKFRKKNIKYVLDAVKLSLKKNFLTAGLNRGSGKFVWTAK